MYADYVITGGESGWPVDVLFNGVVENPPTGRGKCFWEDRTVQCNVGYRKNVALWCVCSVPTAE